MKGREGHVGKKEMNGDERGEREVKSIEINYENA